MESRPIFVALGVLIAGAALADAYTWTDENGVVHFSDRPEPGAKQIQLPEQGARRPSPTYRGPTAGEQVPESEPVGPFRYESLEINAPAAEETLWNIEGVLDVRLNLQPSLQPGHQVRVYFDGQPRMVNGTSFQIREVWRGVHNLQVEIIDESGELMIRSLPNRFYVQQATVL
ncbi:MAG: DUF4124 domain-containing protein [Pseudomonadota bacterium]